MDVIAAAYLTIISTMTAANTIATKVADDPSCEGPDGKHYEINGTTIATNYRLQCQLRSDGSAFFRRVNCADASGNTVIAGSSWEQSGFIWQCQMAAAEGGEVQAKVIGCVKGQRYGTDTIFECVVTDNGDWGLKEVGCVDEEKTLHKVGESWFKPLRSSENWRIRYTCEKFGDAALASYEYEYHKKENKPTMSPEEMAAKHYDHMLDTMLDQFQTDVMNAYSGRRR